MLHKVLYDCKEAKLLIVKREHGRISLTGRLRLYYHLLHCSVCRSFQTQSSLINRLARKVTASIDREPPHKLSDTAAGRLQEIITRGIKKNIG